MHSLSVVSDGDAASRSASGIQPFDDMFSRRVALSERRHEVFSEDRPNFMLLFCPSGKRMDRNPIHRVDQRR
jgi:hypothetical protein